MKSYLENSLLDRARERGIAGLKSVRENWCFPHGLTLSWFAAAQPLTSGAEAPHFLALNAGLKAHSTVSGGGEEKQVLCEKQVLSSVIDIVVPTQSLKCCAAQKQEQKRVVPQVAKPCAALKPVQSIKTLWMKDGILRRVWHDCGAAEIAEAAFVLPLLFVFILGIFQFGRVYLVYSTMQRAAQEGARASAGSTCALCGTGNLQLPANQVASVIVAPIFQNAHVDATLLTVPVTAPLRNSCVPPLPGVLVACDVAGALASPKICVQRNVVLNVSSGGVPTSGTPVCGTSVSLVYPYSFSLPSVSTTPPYISRQSYALNLRAQAQVKGED